ncbi:acyl-CoA dehydrogenase family protein, partial [Acinetobacter baumannii]
MHFVDCFVPDSMVLGEVGAALPLTMGLLSDGRISVASQAVGMARAAFELALDYARDRQAFGKPILDHQAVGFRLADMHAAIDVARVYTRH